MKNAATIYTAIVEDNKDPENRGRVRLRINGINSPSTQIESLPWATPFQPIGGNPSINMLYVPPVKTTCFVSFINGQQELPVVVGYYRQEMKEILQDVSAYGDVRDHAMVYIKLGANKTSPVIKLDSKSEQVTIATRNNISVMGSSMDQQADKGVSYCSLKSDEAMLGFKTSLLNPSALANPGAGITFSKFAGTGYDLKTTGELNFKALKKRTATIGGGLAKSEDMISDSLGISNLMDNLIKSSGIPAAVLNNPFGPTLTPIVGSMLQRGGYDPTRTPTQNLISAGRKDIAKISKTLTTVPASKRAAAATKLYMKKIKKGVPKESKALMKMFKARGASFISGFKNIKSTLKNKVDAVKNLGKQAWEGSQDVVDELTVYGGRNANVSGSEEVKINKNKNDTVNGQYNINVTKNVIWEVNGKSFSIKMPMGGVEFKVGLGQVAIVVGGNPVPPDFLTKMKATNAIIACLNSLISWAGTHMHPTAAPGPPSPSVPPPVAPIAQMVTIQAMKAIPVSGMTGLNLFFTNNFKSN